MRITTMANSDKVQAMYDNYEDFEFAGTGRLNQLSTG